MIESVTILQYGIGESVDASLWSSEHARFQIHPTANIGNLIIETKDTFFGEGPIADLNVEMDSGFC